MIDHLLKAGDRVRMKMNHESRTWGNKGVPDGTLGTIVGRFRAEGIVECRYPRSPFRDPGVYSLDGVPIVSWDEYPEGVDPNDKEYNRVSATYLEPADTFFKEYQERYKKEWPVRLPDGTMNPDFCTIKDGYRLDNMERTGDLPETDFWELDIVTYRGKRYRIFSINYFRWGPEKHHCYNMEEIDENGVYQRSGTETVEPYHLHLLERGNVWKEAHHEPLTFSSLKEKMMFAKNMGRATELRNPKNGLYLWEKEEVLEAVRSGEADGFRLGGNPFSSARHISAMRFEDRDLGEQVRQATIAGFSLDTTV